MFIFLAFPLLQTCEAQRKTAWSMIFILLILLVNP